MDKNEVSAIIGYYRQGATWLEIAYIMGISPMYAEMIVRDYLKNNGYNYE